MGDQPYDINEENATPVGKCPVMHGASKGSSANLKWWPNQLNLKTLNQNSSNVNPMDANFDYPTAFKSLDLKAVKADLTDLMTDSQDWWPADYGTYAGLFVRMAWHSAGTYRTYDGRGGATSGSQRFAPLNSWPDNGNLDKARRLLWPIKAKYGNKLSWADLMILAGNVAMESCGFKTFGFGGGRADIYEPEEDIYWGPETEWLATSGNPNSRYKGQRDYKSSDADANKLDTPLGAVMMGLIYVNPEGPDAVPDPLAAAHDIRVTFKRMAMDDYETVALVAGGHTFGKGHGAGLEDHVGVEPEGGKMETQGFGWLNSHGTGHGDDTTTAGFEGAWTPTPDEWNMEYFQVLLGYEWEKVKSPAGHVQWAPKAGQDAPEAPMAHDSSKTQPLMMTTADMAMKMDPAYNKVSQNFLDNPEEFADAYARAWFKLTHRDMGPIACYLGDEVPSEELIWQDPVPAHEGALIGDTEIESLKTEILASGLSVSQLVNTAWASAASFRGSDKRGGANGARIRLAPQKDWEVNKGTADVISVLEGIQSSSSANVSLADLIVLGGCAAIEKASGASVPFTPGRTDATDEQTDVESFEYMEPKYDGFRNYKNTEDPRSTEALLVDRAQLLGLTAPEMTVLVGGLRSLGANAAGSTHGVLTANVGTLSNDFFVNLLSMDTVWSSTDASEETFEGKDRKSGEVKYTGTRADLVFGSNSILRGLAEVYAEAGSEAKFTADFIAAWDKVMMNDRFDVKLAHVA
ncbi:catalase/peroxidase HPI [Hellea balneolensis]|uniref:catalase/peroxidase HPI n=1 Tax=Hellea balneolensis TaxID=287478 RepID=UPI00042A01FE|nr:catalase/peroxidase HPI [Hellea balneolensis]